MQKNENDLGAFFSEMYSLGLESTLIVAMVHLITTFNIRFACGDLVTVSVTQGGLGLIKHDDEVPLWKRVLPCSIRIISQGY